MKPELYNIWGKAVMTNTLFQHPYKLTEGNNKKTGLNNNFLLLRFETIISETRVHVATQKLFCSAS